MKKKLIALILAVCLCFGALPACTSAKAQTSSTVYVISNTLKVYSKVSTSSRLLGTMSFGESMLCLATQDGWAAVQNTKGQIGFCKITGLSNVNPNTLNRTAYINSSKVPVYRKPTTSSGVMMKLNKNSRYTAVAVTSDGNWTRLKNGKYYGYVQSKYISYSAGGSTTTPSYSTVYIVSNTLKAYKTASTSSKVLGTMSYGESMTLLATSGKWARIRNASGAVGYCLLNGLSTQNPNSLNKKIYINANKVKVYRKPATSSGVMMTLKLNSSYTAVAVTSDGNWTRLKNGQYYGYVQSKYVSDTPFGQTTPGIELTPTPTAPLLPTPTPTVSPSLDPIVTPVPTATSPMEGVIATVYVADNTVDFYTEDSTASKKLGTMSFGESIGLVSVSDGWAKVKNDSGKLGYCLYSSITKYDPNTLNQVMYAVADGVKLYKQPVSGASTVATLKINDSVVMVAATDDGDWARVKTGDGTYSYALLKDLSKTKTAEDDSPIQEISPTPIYIASTTLVCYKENNVSSKQLGVMSFGEMLTCTGVGEGWARVRNENGETGFCKLDGLTTVDPNTYSETLYAQQKSVKVYKKADAASSVSTTLTLNTKVTGVAISPDKSWVRLKIGSGYGYAESKYLATTKVSDSGTSEKINAVIELAQKQLGISYKFGAQSPSSGFDCSGLVYYCFKNAAGITLKRTAYTQATDSRYPSVERSDLKVGDLVFFNTNANDSDAYDHVGIYIGNNSFIHASSGAGKVTTSKLSNDYYNRTYSGAKRIIQ